MGYKKHIINFILLALMIMCIGFSSGFLNKSKDNKEVDNIYLKENSMNMSQINEMQINEEKEEKKVPFTAWKQIEDESIYFEYLGKKAEADVIEICGNSDLIVKGPILFLDNEEGCLLDKKTAYTLFGSTNAKGQVVKYGERELAVIGIHEGLDKTVIVQALKDSKNNDDVTGIAIGVNENEDGSVKVFKNRYSVMAKSVSNRIYYNIAFWISLILPLIIISSVVFKLIKRIRKLKRKPVLFLIYIGITVVVIAIFIKILDLELKIPYDLIPNRWSDFGYWSELFKKYSTDLREVMYMKKYNFDIPSIEASIKSIFFSIVALLLFMRCKNTIKVDNLNKSVLSILFMLVTSFTTILILHYKFSLEVSGLIIWGLYPFYFLATYLSTDEFNLNLEEK
ncbi:MAG: hypothetical protein RR620_07070 [Clostridium sp.]